MFFIVIPDLCSGVVPAKWKQSRVTPIFKEGDRFETSNYHPISVIPAIMKVFERLIHDQLYDYLQVSDIMSHDQSGFRQVTLLKLACLMSLITFSKTLMKVCTLVPSF